ncbi:MAG: cation:proton antiporter regulatory subunit [Candidatus Natronoplasma sp.]
MNVRESELPGVGKKFIFELGENRTLIVIIHHTGNREIYIKEGEDADADKLLELSDRAARTLGSILEGGYFQPVKDEAAETYVCKGTIIEWFKIESDIPIIGKTISEISELQRHDMIVAAVEKEDEGRLIKMPGPETRIEKGDTLVLMGEEEVIRDIEERLFS